MLQIHMTCKLNLKYMLRKKNNLKQIITANVPVDCIQFGKLFRVLYAHYLCVCVHIYVCIYITYIYVYICINIYVIFCYSKLVSKKNLQRLLMGPQQGNTRVYMSLS